ncbi:tetratricopeptide repeat protein [Kangiella aquimarina]|uniref:Uncharacterized protein n=1 Tax=Kangiella aquimarina TaxID=261965 RepID=A0ABZ0X6C2_9GAMM|nr:hypothetical protein [Kangiella aquimarina]WQG86167.1 hypothetical protein SR900_04555 [Kangiella aquimarina]
MNHTVLKLFRNIVLSGCYALPVLLTSNSVYAQNETWVPINKDEVVLEYEAASTTNSKNTIKTNERVNQTWDIAYPQLRKLLSQSSLPGQSHLEQKAQLLADSWNKQFKLNGQKFSENDQAELKLINALLLQKKHRFKEALQELQAIPDSSQLYAQAILIESRIHHIQGNIDPARQSCSELLSQGLPLFAQLCLIETEALAGQPEKSYQLLINFRNQYERSSGGVLIWYHQVAGNIARILKDTEKAEQHFAFKLDIAPVSQWYQWADMAMINGNFNQAYNRLKQFDYGNSKLEDGLFVRLARAEQLIGQDTHYQELAKEKIELRIKRSDKLHAADIAYYYLYVSPDSEQALYWAEQNWKKVKEPSDKELLIKAQSIEVAGGANE